MTAPFIEEARQDRGTLQVVTHNGPPLKENSDPISAFNDTIVIIPSIFVANKQSSQSSRSSCFYENTTITSWQLIDPFTAFLIC